MKSLNESKLKYLLLFLVLADLFYTYLQNNNTLMIDGDLASIAVPVDAYKRVLSDPFGLDVALHNDYYPATNRFFIHFFMQKYFQIMPFVFQKIMPPISSFYGSMILIRVGLHFLIIYLISAMISGSRNLLNINWLVCAVIITPLFQMNGYNLTMGVSLNSITITCFYTLPMVFMLLYFYPFIDYYYHKRKLFEGCYKNQILILLAFMIAMGGPLGAPSMILLICLAFLWLMKINFMKLNEGNLIQKFKRAFLEIPKKIRIHFIFMMVLCIYSLYIGTHNTENFWYTISVEDRYKLMFKGLGELLTKKLGFPLLLGSCILGCVLLYKNKNEEAKKHLGVLSLLFIFAFIYIVMLPFGGYRSYRPLILRSDTIVPVTIALIIIFCYSYYKLMIYSKGIQRRIIIGILIVVAFIYTNADRYESGVNNCQKDYLKTLASSTENPVPLYGWCSLLTWDKFKDPKDSETSAKFIQNLGITKERKLYFHAD